MGRTAHFRARPDSFSARLQPLARAPELEDLDEGVEGELLGRRKLVVREPPQLDEVVAGALLAPGRPREPGEAEHGAARVVLGPHAEELERLDLQACLLAQLAAKRVERILALVEEAAGNVPQAGR